MNTLVQSQQKAVERFSILLIEDSLADARYVKEMLPATAYSLHHVGSLAAAQDYVTRDGTELILLDLSLPDGQGLETFLSLISVVPHIPIIVLTGLDDEDISMQAVRLGAQDYVLKKDITEHTLSRSIRYAIERTRSAMQAKEAEAALKLALRASQTGIWSYDPRTDMTTADDQIDAIFGVELGKFGDSLEDFADRVHVDDRARVLYSIQSALQKRSEYEVEHRIVWPDGSIHHIFARGNVISDHKGNPVRMTGVCVDISKRKEAEEREQSIAKAILENAPIGIARLNNNLVITEANPVFSQQFGMTVDELPGKFIFALPTGIPTDQLLAVVQQGTPFSRSNFRVVLNGSPATAEHFFDLAIWPVKDENTRTTSVVVLTVDVTERVHLAKQREDFVATLTHDLKNPLIGQERMLGLMLEGALGPLESDQTDALSLIKTGTQELLELIGTLLEVYRYEEGVAHLHLTSLDAEKLINGCITQLKPIAEAKGVKISLAFQEAARMVSADQIALKRVVMNLLDNAVKFTPTGGSICVSCEMTESMFVLRIGNSGSRVSANEIRSLFQRFSQTGSGRKHKAGTGLGLYLCRQIVEAHGGEITCTSKEEIGTTFTVALPTALRVQ